MTLKVTLGAGTSSLAASSVGMVKFRVYFPVIFIFRRAVSSSREISTTSFLPALLISFNSSLMFMHIFVGSVHVYSSKIVLGHSKSTMATRDGSIARNFRFSGFILNVASSTSMAMAETISPKSLASDIFSLNMLVHLCMDMCRCYKRLYTLKHDAV